MAAVLLHTTAPLMDIRLRVRISAFKERFFSKKSMRPKCTQSCESVLSLKLSYMTTVQLSGALYSSLG
jgi:hypothetical protein